MGNKVAIIWCKSVYDTGLCPKCGNRVMDDDGQPKGELLFWPEENALFCEKCKLCVSRIRPYDGPGEPGDRMGEWKGDNENEN